MELELNTGKDNLWESSQNPRQNPFSALSLTLYISQSLIEINRYLFRGLQGTRSRPKSLRLNLPECVKKHIPSPLSSSSRLVSYFRF